MTVRATLAYPRGLLDCRWSGAALQLCLAAFLASCCAAKPSVATRAPAPTARASAEPPASPLALAPPSATPQPSAAAPAADAVVARSAELAALAARIEPAITPLLQRLAKSHGGALVKLAYRLKTRHSTERKIRKALSARPGLAVGAVRVEDALRYTMRVADEPPGRYVAAARATLADLESAGHVVQYVKNYWPRDDNYSGMNTVVLDASGLFWELQFHTPESFAAQSDTRSDYEEFRKVGTPLERQRELFDSMSARWNEVPVPLGVLQPGAIHVEGQIRERARP